MLSRLSVANRMRYFSIMSPWDAGRPNRHRAAAIDDVIHALPGIGPRAPARVLVDQGVPFRVICRVIREPDRRRRLSQS